MSNREAPQVVSGPRGPVNPSPGPASAESQAVLAASPKRKPVPPPDPAVRAFRSKYTAYRIQITSPGDEFDRSTGRVIKGRPVVAQFQGGRYETKDPEILKVLLDSKRCGLGLDFWPEELQQKAEANVAVAQALEKVKAVRGLPVDQQAVLDALAESLQSAVVGPGFEMPPTNLSAVVPVG